MNIADIAQNYLVLDAITKGTFGTSLTDFVGLTKNFDQDGLYPGTNNSWELTLPEIASGLFGTNMGVKSGKTPMEMIKFNLQKGGGRALASVVLIPIFFKYGKKLLKKPIAASNRLLKPAGVRL